jgi:hypothetical protein
MLLVYEFTVLFIIIVAHMPPYKKKFAGKQCVTWKAASYTS